MPEQISDSEATGDEEQPVKRATTGCAENRQVARPMPTPGTASQGCEAGAKAELVHTPTAPMPIPAIVQDGGLEMGWHTTVLEHIENR